MKYDMKISPVDNYVWLNDDCTLMIDGDTPEEAANAARALNDFFRITEENAKLLEALKESTEMLENFFANTGSLGAKSQAHKNNALLNQLKEQNNDK